MKTNSNILIGGHYLKSLVGLIILLSACDSDPDLGDDFEAELIATERAGELPNSSNSFDRQDGLNQGYLSIRTGLDYGSEAVQSCRSLQWSNMTGQSLSFVAAGETNKIAISLSGVFSVLANSDVMEVRALVDGQEVTPDGVGLVRNTTSESNSFSFTADVGPGMHTVQLQCKVNHAKATGYYNSTTLKVVQDAGSGEIDTYSDSKLAHLDSTTWADLPGPTLELQSNAGDLLSASASLELWGQGDIEIRALHNGLVMSPPSVTFKPTSQRQGHRATFVDTHPLKSGVGQGVTLQYRVTGGTSFASAKTFYAESRPKKQSDRGREATCVATKTKSTATWETLLSRTVDVPAGSELALELSTAAVQVDSDTTIHTRLVVDGVAKEPSKHTFKKGDQATQLHQVLGAKSFKETPDAGATEISLEWFVDEGNATLINPCALIDYEINVFPWLAQDYFTTDELGKAKTNVTNPVAGVIPRVVIIRHDLYERDTPERLTGQEMISMFTRDNGVIDYLEENSQGRLSIDPNGIEVWPNPDMFPNKYYTSADVIAAGIPHIAPFDYLSADGGIPGELDAEDFRFYNTFDNKCDEEWGPFKMAGDMMRYYAIKMAAADGMRLDQYDTNNDGILQESEVVFIFWSPKPSLANMRYLNRRFCDGSTLEIDGKTMRREINYGHHAVNSDGQVAVLAHELHHTLFASEDLYTKADPATIRPGRFALMDYGYGQVSSHIGAANKVRHGWVTPHLARYSGTYELDDVKDSHDVLYLPRWDVRGSEAYVIEVRKSEQLDNGVNFDQNLQSSGLAIWHVINGQTVSGREARDTPWACNSQEVWDDLANSLKLNRMITPGNKCGIWGDKLWDENDGEILDDPILACAENCSQNNDQSLVWADGTSSGYQISNISAAGSTMTFDLVAPSCENRCDAGAFDPDKVCQCDQACEQFGDCCNDVDICDG